MAEPLLDILLTNNKIYFIHSLGIECQKFPVQNAYIRGQVKCIYIDSKTSSFFLCVRNVG